MRIENNSGEIWVAYEPTVEATCSFAHDKYAAYLEISYSADKWLLGIYSVRELAKVYYIDQRILDRGAYSTGVRSIVQNARTQRVSSIYSR